MPTERERLVYITEGSDSGWRYNWQYRAKRWDIGVPELRESVVTVEFHDLGEVTEVVVVHEHEPGSVLDPYQMGWESGLDKLASVTGDSVSGQLTLDFNATPAEKKVVVTMANLKVNSDPARNGHYVFFKVGRQTYYDPRPDNPYRISRISEVLFVLSTGAAGLFAGQVVRQARRLVRGYPVEVEGPPEGV